MIAVGAALVIEIQWALSRATRPEWLLPRAVDLGLETLPNDVRPDELPDDGRAYLFPTNLADELTKLTALRDQGALTDEEFDAAKQRLLAPPS